MERMSERLAAGAAMLFVAAAVLTAWLAGWSDLRTMAGFTPFHLVGLALALLTWARASLRRRAEEEHRDQALAPREAEAGRLFRPEDDVEGEPFTAARSRKQFERFAVPGAAPVLALALGLLAWGRFRAVAALAPDASGGLAAASLLVVQAFLFFLPARYLLALARDADRRILRPLGAWLGLVPALSLPAAAVALAAHYELAAADRIGATVLAAALALLAGESLVLTLAELYRPRRAVEQEDPIPYESRLARLIAEPAHLTRGAGRAIDYQFGFEVSRTWFYRFLERAVLPLLFLQLTLLYLLSAVVVLAPEEVAVIERFGRPEPPGGRMRGAGLHFKWPWPFETVRRIPAHRIRSVTVGFEEHAEPEQVILWTRPHFAREDLFLTASREDLPPGVPDEAAVPVNLLTYAIRVEFRVRDPYRYLYGHADPESTLRNLAYRVITHESAARGLFDILGEGHRDLTRTVRRRIQEDADTHELGVEIVTVSFQGVHPPIAVAAAFEEVVGAMEEREARILEAGAYRNRRLPVAEAEAQERLYRAEAYRAMREAVSAAEREQFLRRREGYAASPAAFRNRHYLAALQRALDGARLYVVLAEPDAEVIQMNFEERLPATLFDASPED